MDFNEFDVSLKAETPPLNWPETLQALWWDAKGDWEKAHALVDNRNTLLAQWIHAYLHRKEGDLWNADYWYKKAGKLRPSHSLNEEFTVLFNKACLGDAL
ncbi:hypothetical protein EQY75_07455 [Muriicola soli]|uniref:Uncharacterized protein n=1 Tax=Muriicola soli TaxID=2507538 RepID=A0A411EDB4_9FLAO|nr:hypothetical protein EQY75_07455 [Muriicola soli]